MPKIVNHDSRRIQLAEAAWRIIRSKGIDEVSVRNVAEEAGMSLGSLRHYFATHSELLAFSMRLVSDRVESRLRSMEWNGGPRQAMEAIIAELVPLDDDRLAECQVWFAFAGKAIADPSLGAMLREVHDSLHALFRQLTDDLIRLDLTKPGIDAELEAKRMHAMVDGLVVHGVTCPERLTGERIKEVVSYHLDRILR
ncbi:TetR family transcriptional regulator [Paenibacillus hemerocallicola]|uniref:TetR family transcriptional regulator n=1 Tax=Paenibacillus hemerocallicola TaxID=1172614 RepID=A0A5C4TEL2_9BACL|nr:TetR family transcriptional regulator C-terminal domain-containing protein [Paenibacillus hemerocallicola]TNJ66930.1 TetR family transcriptional regulator [Paenibacillus hemerocallicola]